jgi:hypothetical protein
MWEGGRRNSLASLQKERRKGKEKKRKEKK